MKDLGKTIMITYFYACDYFPILRLNSTLNKSWGRDLFHHIPVLMD